MPSVSGAVRGDRVLRGRSGSEGDGDGENGCAWMQQGKRTRLLGHDEGNWLCQRAALERIGVLFWWVGAAFTCPGVCFIRVVPGLRQAR